MDRMIQKLINRLLGRLMNRAIDGGISYVARRGRPASEMSDAERQQAKAGQQMVKKARKVGRAGRKLF